MFKRKGSWILFMPLVALMVSGGIVANQYARRARLTQEIRTANQEFNRLVKLLPKDKTLQPPHDHDHEHEHTD